MRKQNHAIPSALKRDTRLTNAAVPRRRRKLANAQTHGVFAEPLILPGEDPREFEAIHSAWIKEWEPSGPSEESRVFGCADAEWRKLRSRRFAQAKAIANSLNPKHPAFDEARGLISFGWLLCRESETAFTDYANNFLSADTVRYLNDKFPRQNFASTADWVVSVAEEIQSILLPAARGFVALDQDKLDPATEARRTEVIRMTSFVTTIHMREFLDDDHEQQERLDARIAKLIRELIEIKANKQMLRRTQ
jgi:hypothetical protein